MNIVEAKLIAIWCAAVISVPRVPMSIETAANKPTSAVIVIAIGTPTIAISFRTDSRSGAMREKHLEGRVAAC